MVLGENEPIQQKNIEVFSCDYNIYFVRKVSLMQISKYTSPENFNY